MVRLTSRAIRLLVTIAALAAILSASTVRAQTTQRPGGRAQTPARPATQKPAPQKRTPAGQTTQKPAEPALPPKPVAQDLRFKTVYTTGDQRTESVSYQKGSRERYEFADMVLLKQHDLKRIVQISRGANTYLVVPEGAPSIPTAPLPAPTAAPATPGVVAVTTTVVDTGERKSVFGLQARHVKTTIDRQPMPGACDGSKQRIETDGWYVDVLAPALAQSAQDAGAQAPAGGCVDQIKATQNGDPKALGFPISYSMTITGDDGKPNVVAMEVTELEVTMLDAALFDVPAGLKEAGDIRALSQAVSDANEAKLAENVAPPAPKAAGAIRVGVPELVNKTTQQVDTRTLRERLIADLVEAKIEAEPLAAASQADLVQRAGVRGDDYVLVAEVTELKVSKGGGLGGVLKAASSVAGGSSGKEPTEAAIAIKLVQPDGKSRLSSTVKGKDGGFDVKSGLGVAKFAGSMYMNMMTGRLMMNALNGSMTGQLKGMGMLGNPALMSMQAQGLGMGAGAGMGMRRGMDPTAGAASFLMQQAMTTSTPLAGVPGQQAGPSFDAALGEALENAAKAVSENLKKKR